MSDGHFPKDRRGPRQAPQTTAPQTPAPETPQGGYGPDFAARMAKAEFGRHYLDAGRIGQTLERGEIVFRHKRREKPGGG